MRRASKPLHGSPQQLSQQGSEVRFDITLNTQLERYRYACLRSMPMLMPASRSATAVHARERSCHVGAGGHRTLLPAQLLRR